MGFIGFCFILAVSYGVGAIGWSQLIGSVLFAKRMGKSAGATICIWIGLFVGFLLLIHALAPKQIIAALIGLAVSFFITSQNTGSLEAELDAREPVRQYYETPQKRDTDTIDIPVQAKFCYHCGAKLNPGAVFCHKCGKKL